ncbi:NRDE family protein [Sphaerimonospora cavernae]|uniref:NRDE family protein n=1 Tax=Sphaerimonospora cavernae TaxID=1740611 RepID=A0ABV6U5N0_9ACTN
MCTVIVSVDPEASAPVLLAGVRDEIVSRPWMSPARHWPDHPGLIGGRDLEAGGTWLATHPAVPRVAALLNGRGVPAPAAARRSRGELPLLAAETGELPPVELDRYDPFHLLVGGLDGVRLWSWDGDGLTEDKLPPGLHMVVNSGWERGDGNPRASWFLPRFAAEARPRWREDCSPARFWGEWLRLTSQAALPGDDPRALLVRHMLPDGRVFASLSVTLVALAERGMRYDFCPLPDDLSSWHQVETG